MKPSLEVRKVSSGFYARRTQDCPCSRLRPSCDRPRGDQVPLAPCAKLRPRMRFLDGGIITSVRSAATPSFILETEMRPDDPPLVSVIMGSKSDWETLRHADEMLDPVRRAPRVPRRLRPPHARSGWPSSRRGAEGARHRGDHRRRRRRRPPARHGGGPDAAAGARRAGPEPRRSTASTRCCRSSRCPPACRSARSPSARPGATNAALLAVAHPRHHPAGAAREAARVPRRADRAGCAQRRCREPADQPILPGATIGVLGSGQLGRMFAIAARRMGYRVHTLSPDDDTPDRPGRRRRGHGRLRRPGRGPRTSPAAWTSSPSSSRTSPAAATEAAAEHAPVRPAGAVLHTTQHRAAREERSSREHGFPVAPFAPVALARRSSQAALARARHAGGPQDRRLRLRRQGPGADRRRRPTRPRRWDAHRRPGGGPRGVRRLRARGLGGRRPRRSTARSPTSGVIENTPPQPHPRRLDRRRPRVPRRGRRARRSRSPAASSRRSTSSACSASSSSSRGTAACWSTSWRRARTTPAT